MLTFDKTCFKVCCFGALVLTNNAVLRFTGHKHHLQGNGFYKLIDILQAVKSTE